MKSFLACVLLLSLAAAGVSSCTEAQAIANFDSSKVISVVSREEGSGTRGAFIELFGVLVEDGDTEKDMTVPTAIETNKTDVMMTQVAGDPYAIGYLSLGSLNGTVKAFTIDGVEASVDNVKNGSYKIQRPFNIATQASLSEVAQDFINYIMSSEGQSVAAAEGYIAVNESAPAYEYNNATGKIVIAGSSSVTPVMEKLQEVYLALHPDITIEIQMTDSSAGMTSAINGSCDIGMASRELKETELAALTPTVIAYDGIVVIANNSNPTAGLTSEQVRQIFTGEITEWSALAQ
jgi:phosphate transport system substrate-binding protein